MQNSKFFFQSYRADLAKGQAVFNYKISLDNKSIDFTERIAFPPVLQNIPQGLLKSILDNLMLILGISYWKLYCPKEIVIESNFLTQEQAQFWNTVYTKGLGEFFYKNKIDFRGLIQFPFVKKAQSPVLFQRKDRILLGLGGGKDSIVAAELLKAQNKEFDLFTVGTSQIQEEVANVIGKKPVLINRILDPELFDLNKQKGVYNGHVPISAIYAFLGLLIGILYDYNQVVVGNEKSANYGNVEYLGEMINHQWSKSEEFEKLFNNYLQKFVTPDVSYYSPLRNMNELEVVKEFVKYPKYFKVFSSCNRSFKILNSSKRTFLRGGGAVQNDNKKWCGKCPKCLFVFISLAAFLPKEKILDIFGKDLFDDESLLPLFEELIGKRNFKPFECVGTPEEVKEALSEIVKRGEFKDTKLINFYKSL